MRGIWRADAPIGPKKFDELRAVLTSVTTALDGAVADTDHDLIIEDLTVYVDGVKFEWRDDRHLLDYGDLTR